MRLSAHRAPLLRSCTPARHCCTPPLASLPSTRPRLALLASPHAAPPASTSGSSTSGSSTTPSSTTGTTSHGPQRVVATGGRATTTTPSSAHDSAHTLAALSLLLLTATPAAQAAAFEPTNPFAGEQANSLYVTLALFLMSVPGIWSQVKRAPKAAKKRKVYEVEGPGQAGAVPLKDRARQIVTYFKKYNYETKEMGDVITFVGTYSASKGQAAAVTFYTFVGMASIALVLSLLVPQVGNWWYSLTLLAPGAWIYYFRRGTRQEEVKVKMVTADDEKTTDIVIEGDPEEIDRFRKELSLREKGMVYVKGILGE